MSLTWDSHYEICDVQQKYSNLQLFFGNRGFDFSCQIDYVQLTSSSCSQLRALPCPVISIGTIHHRH
jgi:hypothetical protein